MQLALIILWETVIINNHLVKKTFYIIFASKSNFIKKKKLKTQMQIQQEQHMIQQQKNIRFQVYTLLYNIG